MEPWLESFARANFRRSGDTAHDLKTPLNVAVLNLELLRMRLRKLLGEEDPKIAGYTQALETELRRMGRIFDTFFLLSTPPKNEELVEIDLVAVACETAAAYEMPIEAGGVERIVAHESRIRQAFKLFFEGAMRIVTGEHRVIVNRDHGEFAVTVAGSPEAPDLELTRLFKFYYSDSAGNPDLSLAAARVIVETYGGELNAARESDKVLLRMSFPLGAR
jgi:nitrogen fixation/metabolism regulation signal transduction histidine kinase